MVIFTVVSITFYIVHSLPNSYIYNDSEVDEVLKEEFIKKHGEDRVIYDGMGYGSDGELYPLSDFCYDFESVKKAFKEFVLTGDVS